MYCKTHKSWLAIIFCEMHLKVKCFLFNALPEKNEWMVVSYRIFEAFCYQKLFWPFTVWTNYSSDLKFIANSWPSASNFKKNSRTLEQFLLTVGQKNFDNKIPSVLLCCAMCSVLFSLNHVCKCNAPYYFIKCNNHIRASSKYSALLK
jgi:hypothetical protein